MPHDTGGRAYFSEFASLSPSKGSSIQRAKSNEHLSRNLKSKQTKLSVISSTGCVQDLPKAKSTQDLRDRKSPKLAASCEPAAKELHRLEFERELDEHLQKRLRRIAYNTITVPFSVKFSVTGDTPNKQPVLAFACNATMSRPRSPKSKEPQQLEGLEQLLNNIREQLNHLSDERVQMEQRMDDVVNGIHQAQTQYQNHLRNIYQTRKRGVKHSPPTPGSIRRVHSSGEKYTNSTWLIPRLSDTSLDLPDGAASPNQKGSSRTLNFDETASQCSQDGSSMREDESLADSAYGTASKGRRSDSLSSSDSRSRSSSLNIGGSLSQSNDVFGNSWLSSSTIPELPESPRMAMGTPPSSLSQDSFMQSMPSLNHQHHYSQNRHSNLVSPSYRQHRSFSTSTPKKYVIRKPVSPEALPSEPSLRATSSPDVSRKGLPGKSDTRKGLPVIPDDHHNSSYSLNHSTARSPPHNLLHDSMRHTVIAEDSQSVTDSLSQLSTCTEDGSPKAGGSTIIIRRSSLTGQLEHVRKPRSVVAVKRNSSFDVSKHHSTKVADVHQLAPRPRCNSACGMNQTLPNEFRVLNRGVRRKRTTRKPVILNTSVETTV